MLPRVLLAVLLAATVAGCGGDPPSSATAVVLSPSGIPVLVVEEGPPLVTRSPCGDTAELRDWTNIDPVQVVVDPGHGGEEDGAVAEDGLREADVNLAVAERIVDRLDRAGYAAMLTRTGDYQIDIVSRADIALGAQAEAFVSIHHNAGGSPTESEVPGTDVYHQMESPESRRLAGLIYQEVVDAFDDYDDVAWFASRDPGVKSREGDDGDFYGVLRYSAGTPAALSEAAYLSNPTEAELLATPGVQDLEATAIADAIIRWLETDEPGSGFTDPSTRRPAGHADPLPCSDPALE